MKKLCLLAAITASFFTANAFATQIHGFGSTVSSLPGSTLIDFESQPQTSFTNLTIGNVTFSGSGVTSNAYTPGYNSNGINIQNGTSGFQTLNISFAAPTSGFAFNFGASNEDWLLSAFDSSLNLLDSYLLPQTWYNNNGEYFGLASAGITSATLTQLTHNVDSQADHILLDNFAFVDSKSTQVPEPSGLLLLSLGLIGLGLSRRKAS